MMASTAAATADVADYERRIAALVYHRNVHSTPQQAPDTQAASDAPWTSSASSGGRDPPSGGLSASVFAAFPSLYQLHQDVQGRIADRRQQHPTSAASAGVLSPQRLRSESSDGSDRVPAGGSALELVQNIMLSTRRRKSEVPLLPPEHYDVHRSASPPTVHGPPAPRGGCAGCAALQQTVDVLQAAVATLQHNQHRLMVSMLSALPPATAASPSAPDAATPTLQPPSRDALNEADPTAVLNSVVDAWERKAFLPPSSDAKNAAVVSEATMQMLAHVAERLSQLEADMDTTVDETKKMESRIVRKVQTLDATCIKEADLPQRISQWFAAERNEALTLCNNLYRLLGVDVDAGQAAVAAKDVVAVEQLWRASNVARSLQYLHEVAPSRSQRGSAAATDERRWATSSSTDGHTVVVPATIADAPAPPVGRPEQQYDSVGPLPVYTRMLGVHLVDEPFAPGVRVRGVVGGSAASLAGLTTGDCIVAINRVGVKSTTDVIASLAVVMPGAVIKVHRVDGRGHQDVVSVTAGSRRVLAPDT